MYTFVANTDSLNVTASSLLRSILAVRRFIPSTSNLGRFARRSFHESLEHVGQANCTVIVELTKVGYSSELFKASWHRTFSTLLFLSHAI